jgi:uncharacterized protein YcbX
MSLLITSLRRYPVKSMGGESLASVAITSRGLEGDRAWAVRDASNRLASGKNTTRMVRRDGVFAFHAHTGPDRTVTISGPDGPLGKAGDPAVDAALSTVLAAPVGIAQETDIRHFDSGAVSLIGTATLEWCARELGVDADPRRLRANVVVHTDEPFEEEAWIGRDITAGSVRFHVARRIERCRTIDLAQDGVTSTTPWLKALGATRDVRVAVYCDVLEPGVLSVGDTVSVSSHCSVQLA